MKQGYGYEIYKVYRELFPTVTMRSIYYHLKKGVELEEFRVAQIKSEKGHYSWGPQAEKTYYALGKNAKPRMEKRVEKYFSKKKQ